MTAGRSAQTEQALLHHLQAFEAGDVEAIMADYSEDAVCITPDGTLTGHAQIRSLFEQMFAMFPRASSSLTLAKQSEVSKGPRRQGKCYPHLQRYLQRRVPC